MRGGWSSGSVIPQRGAHPPSASDGRAQEGCGQCWHRAHTERNPRRENAAPGRHADLRQSHPPFPACFQVTRPKILPFSEIFCFIAFMFPASIIAVFGCNRRARHPCRLVADWGAYPATLPRETRFMDGHGWRFRTGYRQAVASHPSLCRHGGIPTSGAKPKPAGGTARRGRVERLAAIPPTFPCLLPGDTLEIKAFRAAIHPSLPLFIATNHACICMQSCPHPHARSTGADMDANEGCCPCRPFYGVVGGIPS